MELLTDCHIKHNKDNLRQRRCCSWSSMASKPPCGQCLRSLFTSCLTVNTSLCFFLKYWLRGFSSGIDSLKHFSVLCVCGDCFSWAANVTAVPSPLLGVCKAHHINVLKPAKHNRVGVVESDRIHLLLQNESLWKSLIWQTCKGKAPGEISG